MIGHLGSVEDVKFSPKEKDVIISVGVDKNIILWDLRSSKK